jgi:hypothetical protein
MNLHEILAGIKKDESIKAAMCFVLPHQATEFLTRNTHNRDISDSVVERYLEEHGLGEWYPTSSGIGFDVDGVLIDGQHRLKMAEKSKTGAWLLIVTGLPKVSQQKQDRQRKRTLYDVFKLSGDAQHRKDVQIATTLARIRENTAGHDPSDAKVKSVLATHRDYIEKVLQVAGRKNDKGIGRAAILAALVIGMEHDEPRTTEFITQFVTGVQLSIDSPAYRLRKFAVEGTIVKSTHSGRESQLEDYLKTVAALQAHFDGRKLSVLVRSKSIDFQS